MIYQGTISGIAGIGSMSTAVNGPPPSYGPSIMAASANASIANAQTAEAYDNALKSLAAANQLLVKVGSRAVAAADPHNPDVVKQWLAMNYAKAASMTAAATSAGEGMARTAARNSLEQWLTANPGQPLPTDATASPQLIDAVGTIYHAWPDCIPGGRWYLPGMPHIDAFRSASFAPNLTLVTPSGGTVVNGVPFNPNSKIPLPDPNDPVAVAAYNAARKMEDLFLAQGGDPTDARAAAGDAAGTAAAKAETQQKVMLYGGSGLGVVALALLVRKWLL